MLSAEDMSRRFMPATDRRVLHGHHMLSSTRSSLSDDSVQNDCHDDSMQHIWIVTGPAGCGKTTVAQGLAAELDLPYIEGDNYHSASNKDKMTAGKPLNDADRWDWLIQLRQAAVETLKDDPTGNNRIAPSGVVVTCSALKSKYRDVMRVAAYNYPVRIHFIYLRADAQTLMQRVGNRKDHYMKADMVQSQLEMLEEPDSSSEWDALSIDCAASPDKVLALVIQAVRDKLAEPQESV